MYTQAPDTQFMKSGNADIKSGTLISTAETAPSFLSCEVYLLVCINPNTLHHDKVV